MRKQLTRPRHQLRALQRELRPSQRLRRLPAPGNRANQMAGDTEQLIRRTFRSSARPPITPRSRRSPTLRKLRGRRRHNCATADRRPGHRRRGDRRSPRLVVRRRRDSASPPARLRPPPRGRGPNGSRRASPLGSQGVGASRIETSTTKGKSCRPNRAVRTGGRSSGRVNQKISVAPGRTSSTGQERRFPDCTGTHDTRWRSHTSHG